MFNPINISIANVKQVTIKQTRYPDFKRLILTFVDDSTSEIDIHAPHGLTTAFEYLSRTEDMKNAII